MNESSGNEERVYQPPRGLRVGGMRTGDGGLTAACGEPGSGAEGHCGTGNSPTGWCVDNGNSAAECDSQGSGAAEVVDCRYEGSAPLR